MIPSRYTAGSKSYAGAQRNATEHFVLSLSYRGGKEGSDLIFFSLSQLFLKVAYLVYVSWGEQKEHCNEVMCVWKGVHETKVICNETKVLCNKEILWQCPCEHEANNHTDNEHQVAEGEDLVQLVRFLQKGHTLSWALRDLKN